MRVILWIVASLIGLAVLVLLGSFIYMRYVYSPDQADFQLSATNKFDEESVALIEKYGSTFENGTVISIGIRTPEEEIYFGAKRENDSYVNVDVANKVYEIGSISKVMTGHLLAHFVEEGKIHPEDRIIDLLQLENAALNEIQIVDLVNHTSGLPRLPDNMSGLRSSNPYADYSDELMLAYLESMGKTEDVSEYSNLGFGLIGVILERQSGEKLKDLYQNYLFDPYKMVSSGTDIRDYEERIAPGNGPLGIEGNYWAWQSMAGAGAVVSSASDMLKYISGIKSNEPAVMRLKTPTFVKGKNAIGYGLNCDTSEESKIYWHNGGTGGFRTCMTLDEASGIGVVVLSNLNIMEKAKDNIDRLCFALLKQFITK